MTSMNVLGLVLAAGTSKRMNFDKAMLSINNIPLWSRTKSLLLEAGCCDAWVNMNKDGFLKDIEKKGPLSGIYTCFLQSKIDDFEKVLIVPTDMPALTNKELHLLMKADIYGSDAICFENNYFPMLLNNNANVKNAIEHAFQTKATVKYFLSKLKIKEISLTKVNTLNIRGCNTYREFLELERYRTRKIYKQACLM